MKINHPGQLNKNSKLLGWFIVLSLVIHGLVLSLNGKRSSPEVNFSLSSTLQVTVISSRSSDSQDTLQQSQHAAAEAMPKAPSRNIEAIPVNQEKLPLTAKADDEKIYEPKTSPKSALNLADMKPVKQRQVNERPVKKIPGGNPDTFTRQSTYHATGDKLLNEPGSTRVAQINYLQKQLNNLIRARFTYPLIARRMGWEGLVALSLRIEDDGSLNRIRVSRSSGHKVLDENARKTIEDIGSIQVASSYAKIATDTEIEVFYHLSD